MLLENKLVIFKEFWAYHQEQITETNISSDNNAQMKFRCQFMFRRSLKKKTKTKQKNPKKVHMTPSLADLPISWLQLAIFYRVIAFVSTNLFLLLLSNSRIRIWPSNNAFLKSRRLKSTFHQTRALKRASKR